MWTIVHSVYTPIYTHKLHFSRGRNWAQFPPVINVMIHHQHNATMPTSFCMCCVCSLEVELNGLRAYYNIWRIWSVILRDPEQVTTHLGLVRFVQSNQSFSQPKRGETDDVRRIFPSRECTLVIFDNTPNILPRVVYIDILNMYTI